MRRVLNLILFVCLAFSGSKAQDVHWSQPAGTLLFQNPAFTGLSNKFSASVNYRNQWSALNTSYRSYLFSGDYRFGQKDDKKADFAAGFLFYQDAAGDGKMRTTNGGVTISSIVKMSKAFKLSVGMGFNAVQKSLRLNNYSWGTQYDGTGYNSSLDSRESKNYNSAVFADLNAGMALSFNKGGGSFVSTSKTKFIIGYSISHYNKPNQSVVGSNESLDMKHTVYAQGTFSVKDNVSVKPLLFFYYQSAMMEATAGCLLRYGLGQQSKITGIKKGSAFSFGFLYRYKDALVPTVELEKGTLLFGISYDMNISSLTPASKVRGGLELSIRLINFEDYLYKGRR